MSDTQYEAWLRSRIAAAQTWLTTLRTTKPDDHAAIGRQMGYLRRLKTLLKEATRT